MSELLMVSSWWEAFRLILAWGGLVAITFMFASIGWHIGKIK